MVAKYRGSYEPAVPDDIRRPRPNGPRDDPTIRPGMLVCTIGIQHFEMYKWSNPKDIHPGIYNHPGVILAVHGNNVDFLVISSASMEKRRMYVRMQHIPIWPMEPHPGVGEQLMLKAGQCDKPGYLKVHEVWRLPTRILIKNVDEKTGDELELCPESFEYAKKAVALFDTHHKSTQPLRPFDGFPEVFAAGRYSSPSKTPSIPYSPYNHPRHVHDYRQDSRPSSTEYGTLESQSWRRDRDNRGSSRRNSRSTFHDNRPWHTEHPTPEPQWRQRGSDYRGSSGVYGGYASRDNWPPSTEYPTSEFQWRQRDNGYRASSGEYGGSSSRDRWPLSNEYTTPEPHWGQRDNDHRASGRENGGSAFQNSREDRPSSPFNQRPVTGMPASSHSDRSLSRTNSRSHPQVSTRV